MIRRLLPTRRDLYGAAFVAFLVLCSLLVITLGRRAPLVLVAVALVACFVYVAHSIGDEVEALVTRTDWAGLWVRVVARFHPGDVKDPCACGDMTRPGSHWRTSPCHRQPPVDALPASMLQGLHCYRCTDPATVWRAIEMSVPNLWRPVAVCDHHARWLDRAPFRDVTQP